MKARFLAVMLLSFAGLGGCDTKAKVDKAIDKVSMLLENYSKLGKNLSDSIDAAKAAATKAVQTQPAMAANVAPLPSSATGGTDLNAMVAGKQGALTADLKGDGKSEDVSVVAADSGTVFESWQGIGGAVGAAATEADAGAGASYDDSGLCYLGWQQGTTTWLVVSACGDPNGGWVCQVTGGGESCRACNVDGRCDDCAVSGAAPCAFPGFSG